MKLNITKITFMIGVFLLVTSLITPAIEAFERKEKTAVSKPGAVGTNLNDCVGCDALGKSDASDKATGDIDSGSSRKRKYKKLKSRHTKLRQQYK